MFHSRGKGRLFAIFFKGIMILVNVACLKEVVICFVCKYNLNKQIDGFYPKYTLKMATKKNKHPVLIKSCF